MQRKLLYLFMLIALNSKAQVYRIDFENPLYFVRIHDDTFRNSKPWVIGVPNKSQFKYEILRNNVIMTDSSKTLSGSDTFSFLIEFVKWQPYYSMNAYLEFKYKLNGDTSDHFVVEVSTDKGKNWIDFYRDDSTYDFVFQPDPDIKPKLNGNILEWSSFKVDYKKWANTSTIGKYPILFNGIDTILYRFTYITGNSGNHGDGMVIDSIDLVNYYTSIPEVNSNAAIKLSPNPAGEQISIVNSKPDNPIQKVIFYDLNGRVLHEHFTGEISSIDVSAMPPGLYTVLIETQNAVFSQRLLIAR